MAALVHRIQVAPGAWPLLPEAACAAISRATKILWTPEADPSLLSFASSRIPLAPLEASPPDEGPSLSGELVLLQGHDGPLPAWIPDSILQEHDHIGAPQLPAPASPRVLLTRHATRNRELGRALLALGIPSLSLPTLEYAPCPDPEALEQAYRTLDRYFGIILSSPHGAHSFDPPNALPAGLQILAVGASTAAALQARGYSPTLIPEQPHSEGLVEALRSKGWLAKRWLHFRGDKGRPLLERAIRGAGGHYDRITLYLSQRPSLHRPLLEAALHPTLEAISFASGQSYEHFKESLTTLIDPSGLKAQLARMHLLSFGPVTTAALQSDGLEVHHQLSAPGLPQQLEAIKSLLAP